MCTVAEVKAVTLPHALQKTGPPSSVNEHRMVGLQALKYSYCLV
jgi:hypothetical protein